jgi:hypothetical protein
MQAFGLIVFEKGLVGAFIMPGFIGGAGLHRGEDMNQPGVFTPLTKNLSHSLLLTKLRLADEINLQASTDSDLFGILADFLTEWFGPLGIVKDADAMNLEIAGHAFGVTKPWQGAGNNNAVVAGEYTSHFIHMPLQKAIHIDSPQVNSGYYREYCLAA